MSEVTRYRMALEDDGDGFSPTLREAQNGGVVLYEDCAALEAELAEAKRKLEQAEKRLERMQAPISAKEWKKFAEFDEGVVLSYDSVNDLLADRASKKEPDAR